MNVCEKAEYTKTRFICGNLYKHNKGILAIYSEFYNSLIDVKTGFTYTVSSVGVWEDVTDQYCLQKL